MAYPLRRVTLWVQLPPKNGLSHLGRPQWHARFECEHVENFGAGERPRLTEYACAQCPPLAPQ